MGEKTALLVGATGLTGSECLQQLLANNNYIRVVALVRGKLPINHPRLEVVQVDFNKLDDYKDQIKADHIYCTLGTTIARAGSQQAFKKVDYEYPLKTAQLALWNGAQKFILVSSLGANSQSGIFYSRVKGELEEALKKLKYPSLIIFRPSILLGHRKEKRAGEAVGQWVSEKLSFLFSGPLKMYRGTPVKLLAQIMVKVATDKTPAVKVVENREIFELAENT